MKKYVIKFLVLLIGIIPCLVKAENYDYIIENFDIQMEVNENNTFNITENIDVYFNQEKHGIYRTIPLKNEVTRLDGSRDSLKAKVKNVSINDNYSVYTSLNNYKQYKIGNANKTILGSKKYVIKYLYELEKENQDSYDELYFNLVGSGWNDTSINNVNFKITMPKDFDISKVGFSVGPVGSTSSDNVVYEIKDNVIIGSYNGILEEGDALTIRVQLPEGYFVVPPIYTSLSYILMLIIPIILMLAACVLWFIYGNDDKVVETVEFYPPDDLNSLELAFCKKGSVTSEDVMSLLIYLASKGYIKIVERENKSVFGAEKDFTIIKAKEYDGHNDFEKDFMDGLFIVKDEVTKKDLKNNFYRTIKSILKTINGKRNQNKIFESASLKKKLPLIIMAIVAYITITIPPVWEELDPAAVVFPVIFPIIAMLVMKLVLKEKNLFSFLFSLIWGIGFGGIPWIVTTGLSLTSEPLYIIPYTIGIICILIILIFEKIIVKRTKYGIEILGKIKGFETFLRTVEKEKLEKMVMKNPTYFYDILPYTYVLNISNKWIEKFEDIAYEAPEFYDGISDFDSKSFNSFMSDTMISLNDSYTSSGSSGSSSSSGTSSGGGSSGGGSGGGGGGSW